VDINEICVCKNCSTGILQNVNFLLNVKCLEYNFETKGFFADNLMKMAQNYEQNYKRQVLIHGQDSPKTLFKLVENEFKQIGKRNHIGFHLIRIYVVFSVRVCVLGCLIYYLGTIFAFTPNKEIFKYLKLPVSIEGD